MHKLSSLHYISVMWQSEQNVGTSHLYMGHSTSRPLNYTHQIVWTVEVRTGICGSSSRPEQLWGEIIRINDHCGTEHNRHTCCSSSHDEQETRQAPPPGQRINLCYGCGASHNRDNCRFWGSTCRSCKRAGHTERSAPWSNGMMQVQLQRLLQVPWLQAHHMSYIARKACYLFRLCWHKRGQTRHYEHRV